MELSIPSRAAWQPTNTIFDIMFIWKHTYKIFPELSFLLKSSLMASHIFTLGNIETDNKQMCLGTSSDLYKPLASLYNVALHFRLRPCFIFPRGKLVFACCAGYSKWHTYQNNTEVKTTITHLMVDSYMVSAFGSQKNCLILTRQCFTCDTL